MIKEEVPEQRGLVCDGSFLMEVLLLEELEEGGGCNGERFVIAADGGTEERIQEVLE